MVWHFFSTASPNFTVFYSAAFNEQHPFSFVIVENLIKYPWEPRKLSFVLSPAWDPRAGEEANLPPDISPSHFPYMDPGPRFGKHCHHQIFVRIRHLLKAISLQRKVLATSIQKNQEHSGKVTRQTLPETLFNDFWSAISNTNFHIKP